MLPLFVEVSSKVLRRVVRSETDGGAWPRCLTLTVRQPHILIRQPGFPKLMFLPRINHFCPSDSRINHADG